MGLPDSGSVGLDEALGSAVVSRTVLVALRWGVKARLHLSVGGGSTMRTRVDAAEMLPASAMATK